MLKRKSKRTPVPPTPVFKNKYFPGQRVWVLEETRIFNREVEILGLKNGWLYYGLTPIVEFEDEKPFIYFSPYGPFLSVIESNIFSTKEEAEAELGRRLSSIIKS